MKMFDQLYTTQVLDQLLFLNPFIAVAVTSGGVSFFSQPFEDSVEREPAVSNHHDTAVQSTLSPEDPTLHTFSDSNLCCKHCCQKHAKNRQSLLIRLDATICTFLPSTFPSSKCMIIYAEGLRKLVFCPKWISTTPGCGRLEVDSCWLQLRTRKAAVIVQENLLQSLPISSRLLMSLMQAAVFTQVFIWYKYCFRGIGPISPNSQICNTPPPARRSWTTVKVPEGTRLTSKNHCGFIGSCG